MHNDLIIILTIVIKTVTDSLIPYPPYVFLNQVLQRSPLSVEAVDKLA